MSKIQVQDRPAFYREWGSGETTLLLLHGWGAQSADYQELAPLLAKAGYRVIVPDLPGWGQTPPPPQAWTVSDYRDWVHDLLEALNIKEVVLFGHSFGGRVAIKYVIKYPYQVQRLILCAAAGVKPDPTTIKRRMLKISAMVGKKAFSLPGVNQLAPLAKKVLYKAAGSNDYLKVEGVMKETIVKVLEEDLSPLLPRIAVKTKLFWGAEDGATPLEDGKRMQELIPGSSLHVFEGTRHNLPKLIPGQLAKELIDYLGQQPLSTID